MAENSGLAPLRGSQQVSPDAPLWYCTSFDNHSGLCAIVRATSARSAQSAARDGYYGTPGTVRRASEEEMGHHRAMGGRVIEAWESAPSSPVPSEEQP